MRCVIIVLGLFSFLCSVNCLKILCVFPTVSYSHYTIGHTLVRQLAKRGHKVTFIAPFPETVPTKNLHTIVLKDLAEEWTEFMKGNSPLKHHSRSPILGIPFVGHIGSIITEKTLSDRNVQQLLNSRQEFDIVLVEHFFTEALLAISNHFGAPSVLVATYGQSFWANHIFGSPDIPSYMAGFFTDPPVHESFFKRTCNLLIYVYQKFHDHLYFYPKQNRIIQRYLPNSPHIYDLIYNTSLILFNGNKYLEQSLPKMPNMIDIGGLHIEPAKKLPDALQNTLDKAKHGAVYFSMGSVLKSKDLPMVLRNDLLQTFSQLKETVLWKFEEDLPEKPANVIIEKWFPQQHVLAHPNVKLFITHGGGLSTMESLARGVPVIGIPIFGDQRMNMVTAVNKGFGLMLPYGELSGKKLSEALYEVLNNPKYAESAKYGAKIMMDQLVSPIDRAEYWIKYVVRHKGAKHLRSAALDLAWYQRASLDVILFLATVTIALFATFYFIIRWLLGRRKPQKQKRN